MYDDGKLEPMIVVFPDGRAMPNDRVEGDLHAAEKIKAPELLVPNPSEAPSLLRLLWLSCGDQDYLKQISDRIHAYLAQHGVPHVWYEERGSHDWTVWKNDLYLFFQLLFKA